MENQGRINYGPLLGEAKGILGGVQLDRRLVHGWTMRCLPLDRWDAHDLAAHLEPVPGEESAQPGEESALPGEAGFAQTELLLTEPADTFLALPGSTKGFVWVNEVLLGRYWDIGPQRTLYVPAGLLRAGRNTLTVLELERLGNEVALCAAPELGPEEEFIETF